MYKNKTVLGIITARGGSKGVPRKNLKNLCGRPLISYTIEAAKKSKYLTRCVISTEDQEIAAVGKKYGAEVPFMRPKELAEDSSTSIEVVQHAINWFRENEKKEFDYILILQPTSPLRNSEDIDLSIQKIVETDSDSVMGMIELPDFSIVKLKKIENDLILPFLQDEGAVSSSRQSLSPVYKRNCAIYLTRTDLIIKGEMFGSISRPHIMPRERSVDINEFVDFEIAEFWLKKLAGESI